MTIPAVISAATEPTVVLFFLGISAAWRFGLRGLPFAAFILYAVLCIVLASFLRLRYVRKVGTNWDVSDRKKRFAVMIPFLLLCIVLCSLLVLWRNTLLLQFAGYTLVWFAGMVAITSRLKISGHVAVLALAVGHSIRWYGSAFLPLLLLLPAVAWSRLSLKRHTPVEVIGGAIYSILFVLLW